MNLLPLFDQCEPHFNQTACVHQFAKQRIQLLLRHLPIAKHGCVSNLGSSCASFSDHVLKLACTNQRLDGVTLAPFQKKKKKPFSSTINYYLCFYHATLRSISQFCLFSTLSRPSSSLSSKWCLSFQFLFTSLSNIYPPLSFEVSIQYPLFNFSAQWTMAPPAPPPCLRQYQSHPLTRR